MHAWHCQSPAAHVLISDKLILGVQVTGGQVVLPRGDTVLLYFLHSPVIFDVDFDNLF